MSAKSLLIVLLLVLSTTLPNDVQVVNGSPPVPENNQPDLIVKEIIFESSPTKIRVRVLNEGTGASTSCHLALMSMAAESAAPGTKRVWTIPIPGLEAGKGFSNVIEVSPLSQTNGPWKAVIDRSNTVKESDESNNQLSYSPGGSPKVRMPDLQITRAVLIDATTGEVSVEISNTETGTAPSCQLRLIVWEMGKFEQKDAKTVFVKVPAIGPIKKANVKIKAGVPIISTKYSLFIDISNEVTEKNENNNRYEGDAGKS